METCNRMVNRDGAKVVCGEPAVVALGNRCSNGCHGEGTSSYACEVHGIDFERVIEVDPDEVECVVCEQYGVIEFFPIRKLTGE